MASTSSSPSSSSRPDAPGMPWRAVFETQCIPHYLSQLAPSRRAKALIDRATYDRALRCNQGLDTNPQEDAQFRFWAKKSFETVKLPTGRIELYWDGMSVAVTDDIYDILVQAHAEVDHGGRDMTFARISKVWSKLPKGLVQAFVNLCPTCRPNADIAFDPRPTKALPPKKRQPTRKDQPKAKKPRVAVEQQTPPLPIVVQSSAPVYFYHPSASPRLSPSNTHCIPSAVSSSSGDGSGVENATTRRRLEPVSAGPQPMKQWHGARPSVLRVHSEPALKRDWFGLRASAPVGAPKAFEG